MYAQHAGGGREFSSADVPHNYSGNAFRYPPPTTLKNAPSAVPSMPERESEPTPNVDEREALEMQETEERHVDEQEEEMREQEREESEPQISQSHVPALLAHGIGNEELLLLGMLLLLTGNENERNDLPLYLLLLLFCG